MATLNFNALAFDSQQLPESLPTQPQQVSLYPPAPPVFAPNTPLAQLTLEQQADLGKDSEYVGVMDTPAKVLAHWQMHAQVLMQRKVNATLSEKKPKQTPEERARKLQVHQAHSHVVTEANLAWRRAVAERARVLEQHNEIVRQLHEEYKRLKNMKVE